MKKICLECEEVLIGRSDKKFCNDYCRNAYNNKRNKERNTLIRQINTQLRKNYRILEEFNPLEKTKASRTQLLGHGFDFNLYTTVYTTKKGSTYYFVYDLGYLPLENDRYMLVKKLH